MESGKHLLVNNEIFELVNKKWVELNLKGFKVNKCDITNMIIRKEIDNVELYFNESNQKIVKTKKN